MRASMELTPGPHGNPGGMLVPLCAWADSLMVLRVEQMPEGPSPYFVGMIEKVNEGRSCWVAWVQSADPVVARKLK